MRTREDDVNEGAMSGRLIAECLIGLFWALIILLTLFVHFAVNVELQEFRYIGF